MTTRDLKSPHRVDRMVAESTIRPAYRRHKWHPAWKSFEMITLYLLADFAAGLGAGWMIWR